jgi:hypothetical protein
MDQTAKIVRESDWAQCEREVLGHFPRIKGLEVDLTAEIVNREVLAEAAQGACGRAGGGPQRSDQEQP